MEIDFLGLNSFKYSNIEQKEAYKNHEFTDSDNQVVETFLSLSTSSSIGCQRDTLDRSKKKWEFGYDKVVPSCSSSSSNTTLSRFTYYNRKNVLQTEPQPTRVLASTPIFHPTPIRYNLNETINSRNISQLPCCSNVYNDALPKKVDNTIYSAGNISREPSSDARKSSRGCTPTVAMARRATLARFLEKRLHRMNQAKTSHFTTNSEDCDTSIVKYNMGKNIRKHEKRLR